MKNIIKNYLFNMGYQITTLIIPFISIPYISRVLGPENLGIEAFTSSLVAIFISIANAGTSIYSIRQVAVLKDDKIKLTKEVYNIIFFRIFLSLLSLILFLLYIKNSEYKDIFVIQTIFLIGSTFIECTWYFIGKEQFKITVVRNLFIKFVGLISTILFVKDANDLMIYILINAVIVFLPNLSLFMVIIRELGFPKRKYFSISSIKRLTFDIFPFFVMGFIIQIYMNIDKVILERIDLIDELGYYSQFVKSYSVFLAPITAVGTILMPKLSNLIINKKNGDNILNLSSNYIFILCVPIIFGLLSVSSEFVSIFYGNSFSKFELLFRIGLILIFTGSLSNIVIQLVVFPFKFEKIYNFALIISSLIRVLIIFVLVDSIGVYAAVIAYIVSEIILVGICIYKIKESISIMKLLINYNNTKIFLSGLVMYLLIISINDLTFLLKVFVGILIYLVILFLLKENLTVRFLLTIRKLSVNKDQYSNTKIK